MARYIDAVSKAEVLETYAELYDVFDDYKGIQKELHKVYDKLNALPTADVVEVVRCKDCEFYYEDERMCNDTNGFDRYWKPTDFCSYGKRREDGSEL